MMDCVLLNTKRSRCNYRLAGCLAERRGRKPWDALTKSSRFIIEQRALALDRIATLSLVWFSSVAIPR